MQRGWSSFADTRQKTIATSPIRTKVFYVFRGSVSAEMSIRSASAGTSLTLGFTSGFGWLCETGSLFWEFGNQPFQNLKLVIAWGAADLNEKLVRSRALEGDV